MVEDPAVDCLGRMGKAARRPHVAVAWSRISAGMIVSQQDARAPVHRRVDHDRAEREIRSALVPIVVREMKAIQVVVDMGDPEPLTARIALRHAARKECAGGGEAVKLERKFGTLISHEPRLKKIGRGNDRNRVR